MGSTEKELGGQTLAILFGPYASRCDFVEPSKKYIASKPAILFDPQ